VQAFSTCDRFVEGYPELMPSSIIRVASLDHERIRRLVRRACTEGPSQARWRDELVGLVEAHRAAEDEALGSADPAVPPEAVERLRQVDADLDAATAAMAAATIPSSEIAEVGRTFQSALTAHVDELDGRLLQALGDSAPRKELRRLGGLYVAHRDQALHDHGEVEPPRRLDVSRAELYELARRAGIEGRSSMSRRDLIVELERRQRQPR
jgi:hypothetical protein